MTARQGHEPLRLSGASIPTFLLSTAVILPFRLHFFTSMDETSIPYDCQDVGCTWPGAHHLHELKERDFDWYPDLERLGRKVSRVQSEGKVGLKDCQFCRIFFNIGQSGCHTGANRLSHT